VAVNRNPMKPNQSNGKWWLAAILSPFVGFGFGYFFAITAPHNTDDWFGLAVLTRLFLGLLIGCVLSSVATIISSIKRERFFGIALLAGIPSLIFVVNVCSQIPKAAKNAKLANEHFLAYQKQVAEQQKQAVKQEVRVIYYREELRTNSSLITNDDFWNAQANQDRSVEAGLVRLIEDQSFILTPEMKNYLIRNGHDYQYLIRKCLNNDERIQIVTNTDALKPERELAMNCLLWDKSFEITDQWKHYVLDNFPQSKHYLIMRGCFSKSELEALAIDPNVPALDRIDAGNALKMKYYR
jgi:hypothetical protein